MSKQLRAFIIGAGSRAMQYASHAQQHPEELKIVGVVEPDLIRRQKAADLYDIPAENCFESTEELVQRPQMADFVINGTMDQHHVPTCLPLLEAGYDILLEKPFATDVDEMWNLVEKARQCGRKIAICHVLRHTPFYSAIRQKLLDGAIGEIINIQASEHVSYHHTAVAFVRGKWGKTSFSKSSMLMAKSCHDLDLIAWLNSGIRPTSVGSFGSIFQFRSDKAPEGHGTHCLVDCSIEEDCLYSAKKHYIDHPDRWSTYTWDTVGSTKKLTLEEKMASLKNGNPYGRCVWECDNDIVDHQSLAIEFENGSTATLNMIGGTAKPSRKIHIIGTHGEIEGCFEDSQFVVRHIDPRPVHEYSEETIDINIHEDTTGVTGQHGGGDLRVIADFLRVLRGEKPSISSTDIEDSINGHLIGFCADRSARERKTVEINPSR
jgi:predicted dehydrogenase